MVGNPSFPAFTLSVLALHAMVLSPASATVDNNYWNRRRSKQKHHLRHRQADDSQESPPAPESEGIAQSPTSIVERMSDGTQRRQESCLWHADRKNEDGCTNDDDIPEEWLAIQVKGIMLHQTSESCCKMFFNGRECKIYDRGCQAASGESCSSHGWHADMKTQNGCTDDDNYPESWALDASTQNYMFHATPEKCCASHFSGRECNILHSGCGQEGSSSNDQTNDQPTCVSPGWYADNTHRDGCSNGNTYPEEWLEPPMRKNMFYSSSQACCNMYFSGGDCKIYDVGCTINPDMGVSQPDDDSGDDSNDCESEWHPDVESKQGCSNDDNYPPEWKDAENNATHFFSTAEDCCQKYTQPGWDCQVRDCANKITTLQVTSGPTSSPTHACLWHPSLKANDRCDYSDSYPLEWLEPKYAQDFFFDTHEECCLGAHGVSRCGIALLGLCQTSMPSLKPTRSPSLMPTPSPVVPTPPPSASPTIVFYVQHFTGKCIRDSEVPKPFYIKDTYNDYDECCKEGSHNKEDCVAAGPTDPPTIFYPTISPAPTTTSPTSLILYYVDHHSGSCLNGIRKSIPFYVTDSFTNYWACCRHSFDTEKCLMEGPTLDPTSQPSGEASALPSSQPSLPVSSQPSSRPSEPPAPTSPPTTFYHGALKSFSSKPTHRPTKQDCSNLLWHVDTEALNQGCTNYDLDQTQSTVLLFETAEACCAFSFDEGLDCSVRDNCKLTNSLIFAEREDSCENWWHPDTVQGLDGCSNYLHIPDSWKQPQNKANLLFDTAQECCQKLYIERGDHCKIYNYCTTEPPTIQPTKLSTPRPSPRPISPQPITPAPTVGSETAYTVSSSSCLYAKWHLSIERSDATACSNSLTYPKAWDDPSRSTNFLFGSHSDCCARFAPGNPNACRKVDDCVDAATTTSPTVMATTTAAGDSNDPDTANKCVSARWHITQDFSKCSNNFEYPLSWLEEGTTYFFDYPTECCMMVFSFADCEIEDICASESTPIFLQPVNPAPTWGSKMVHAVSPSCDSAKWHYSTKRSDVMACSNSLTYPEAWNHPTRTDYFLYDSYSDCCARFSPHNPNACRKDDDCVDATTTSSTVMATTTAAGDSNDPDVANKCVSARWHITQDFSKCSNNFEYPLSWLEEGTTYFFDYPTECCMMVFSYADCEIEDICASEVTQINAKTPNSTQESTPKPSLGMPTRGPTLKPSTRMPTRAPLQKINAMDDSHDHCSVKSRRQCLKDPGCRYDLPGRICVKVETKSQTTPEPSTMTKPAVDAKSRCGGMLKKQCVKDPECIWHTSEKSCARLATTSGDIHENKGGITTTTTTTPESTTPASQNCVGRRWHPKTVTDRTCSNSHDYPPLWDNHPYSEQYLFNSFKQCCKVFYGGTCNQEDVCEAIASR